MEPFKNTSHKGEKRRLNTLEFKVAVVKYAQVNTNRSSGIKSNVDTKRVRMASEY